MLEGGKVKAIYELQGKQSIRKIAETLGISRNTVRRYLRDPDRSSAPLGAISSGFFRAESQLPCHAVTRV